MSIIDRASMNNELKVPNTKAISSKFIQIYKHIKLLYCALHHSKFLDIPNKSCYTYYRIKKIG
jgi:hypothetical protein